MSFFCKLEIIISNFTPPKMGALVLKLQEVAFILIRDYILYIQTGRKSQEVINNLHYLFFKLIIILFIF